MTQDTAPAIGFWIKTLWALNVIVLIMVSIAAGESATIRVTASVVSPFGYYDSEKAGSIDRGEIGANNKAVFLSGNSTVICRIEVGNLDSKEFLLNESPSDIDAGDTFLLPLNSIRDDIGTCANPDTLSGGDYKPVVITFFYSEN